MTAQRLTDHHQVVPRRLGTEIFQHIYRENNTRADALAKQAKDTFKVHLDADVFDHARILEETTQVRIFTDGSATDKSAGCGWVLEVRAYGSLRWHLMMEVSSELPVGTTAMLAEILALQSALALVKSWLNNELVAEAENVWRPKIWPHALRTIRNSMHKRGDFPSANVLARSRPW